jgi:hypothetical protein
MGPLGSFGNMNLNERMNNNPINIKKSDEQVGRVNTFHILQTIRKGPLTFKLCMKRPFRFSNF